MAKSEPKQETQRAEPTMPPEPAEAEDGSPARKLSAFLDLIVSGDVPYAKIAELADVAIEDVEAFVLELEGDEPDRDAIEPPESLVRTPPEPELPARDDRLSACPEPEQAPRAVRAVRKARIRDADGKSWRIELRDVYHGGQAAFLWHRHRSLVEPYPLPR